MSSYQDVIFDMVESALVSREAFALREGAFEGRSVLVLECLDPPAPEPRPMNSRPSGVESRYAAVVAGWVAFLQAQGWDVTKAPPWSPEEAHHAIVFGRNKLAEDPPIEESPAIE